MKSADRLSPGGWVVLTLAVLSTILVLVLPRQKREGMPFWVFFKTHATTYEPIIAEWNRDHPDEVVDLAVIQGLALERRLLSGFMSGTPVADLVETERAMASRVFSGPVESIGFVDLTDRLRDEGLLDTINRPSLAPWTSRGRIYGIPHDVHPMLLAYRADIVEAAGIDVSQIETWDDFRRILGPLMKDFDGDGRKDRFLIGGWPDRPIFVEPLLRQAGGAFFDENDHVVLASEINAHTLATITAWCAGPDRLCTAAHETSGAGHKLRLDGTVICTIMPDWMVGMWKQEIPGISGKLKLMPLPAFTPGGLRTSVWGGTMLAITKSASNFDSAWEFAKALYLSPKLAESLFVGTGIISPVKANWALPFYDEPDPYFSGQPIGRLFIDQAPHVPMRTGNPFEYTAQERAVGAAVNLLTYAEVNGLYTAEELLPEARRLLALAQKDLEGRIARNVFLPQ